MLISLYKISATIL